MKTFWMITMAVLILSANVYFILELKSAKKREFAAYEMGSMIGKESERLAILKRLGEQRMIWAFVSDGNGQTTSRAVFLDEDGKVYDEKLNAPGILP